MHLHCSYGPYHQLCVIAVYCHRGQCHSNQYLCCCCSKVLTYNSEVKARVESSESVCCSLSVNFMPFLFIFDGFYIHINLAVAPFVVLPPFSTDWHSTYVLYHPRWAMCCWLWGGLHTSTFGGPLHRQIRKQTRTQYSKISLRAGQYSVEAQWHRWCLCVTSC